MAKRVSSEEAHRLWLNTSGYKPENVVSIQDIKSQDVSGEMGHTRGRIWWIFTPDSIGTEGMKAHIQEYEVGGYTEDHPPHNNIEQVYYVISGTMAVHISGKDYVAKSGSMVFIPRGAIHRHRNAGKDKLVFFTVNIPVKSGEVPPVPKRS